MSSTAKLWIGERPQRRASARNLDKQRAFASLFGGPPARVDRFTILKHVGSGGMGEVYAAWDSRLDRKVAIKLVQSDRQSTARANQRLLREGKTLAQLNHPNVVQVYDVGVHDGRGFVAMEFVQGHTLTGWLEHCEQESGALHWREVLALYLAAGRGLEAAHAAGLMHRDFKPANVLVGTDGRPRVLDFGLARVVTAVRPRTDARPDSRAGAGAVLADRNQETNKDANNKDANNKDANNPATAKTRLKERPEGRPDEPQPSAAPQPGIKTFSLDDSAPDGAASDRGGAEPEVRVGLAELASTLAESQNADGSARSTFDDVLTVPGAILGTPAYMPLEQMRGQEADERSDQFSFCVALYEGLYGHRPFSGKDLDELRAKREALELVPPEDPNAVPRAIHAAIVRGLAPEPDDRFPTMSALLAALETGAARPRRWWLLALVAALFGTLLAGMVMRTSDARPPCSELDAPMAALWNQDKKDQIRAAILATRVPYAEATWATVERHLDDYAESYQRARVDACRATHVERTQSPALLDQRMLCLQRGHDAMAPLLKDLAGIDESSIEYAARSATELPALAVCEDGGFLQFGMAPPASAEQRDEVRDIRARLAEAETARRLHRLDRAKELAEEQLRRAEAIDYPPVLAEALFQLGRIELVDAAKDDVERVRDILHRASNLSEQWRHDLNLLESWLRLVQSAHTYRTDRRTIERWLQRAEALVERVPGSTLYRAELARLRGLFAARLGQFERAEKLAQSGLTVLDGDTDTAGVERAPLLRSSLLLDRARALDQLGASELAAELIETSLSIRQQLLGNHHPYVANGLRNLGIALLNAGSPDRALPVLEKALEIHRDTRGDSHTSVGLEHLQLAEILHGLGHWEKAWAHALQGKKILDRTDSASLTDRALGASIVGGLAYRRCDYERARGEFQIVLALETERSPRGSLEESLAQLNMAEVLLALTRYEQAQASLAAAEKELQPQSEFPEVQAFLASVEGRLALTVGDLQKARRVLRVAMDRFSQVPEKLMRLERADAAWALAQALSQGPDSTAAKEAVELARLALSTYTAHAHNSCHPGVQIERWLQDRKPDTLAQPGVPAL